MLYSEFCAADYGETKSVPAKVGAAYNVIFSTKLSHYSDKCCQGIKYWHCTREKRHSGPHVAMGGADTMYAYWYTSAADVNDY